MPIPFGKVKITEPRQLEKLLVALQNVDAQAYAYTTRIKGMSGVNFRVLTLTRKNGETLNFSFWPSPDIPNDIVRPLWELYRKTA